MADLDMLEDRIEDLEALRSVATKSAEGGPLPHDGMRSRSFAYGAAVTGFVLISAAVAVGFGKLDAATAIDKMQILLPTVMAITLGKMWGDKKLEADLRKPGA